MLRTHAAPRLLRLPRPAAVVIAALVVAGSTIGWARLTAHDAAPRPPVPVATAVGHPQSDVDAFAPLAQVDRSIAVWTGNLQRDEQDFIAAGNLAQLYLVRVRLTADPADLTRAASAVDAARSANPGLVATELLGTQVKQASHDFAGARESARVILDANPDLVPATVALGDAELELGDYASARAAFRSAAQRADGPAIQVRLARLQGLTGNLAAGVARADRAAASVSTDPDATATDVAWYLTFAGSLHYQAGDLQGAERAYRAAVRAWPGSAAALAGLARTRAASGFAGEAIDLYRRSVAIVPNPDALAGLADLLTLTGRDAEAARVTGEIDAVARLAAASGIHDRQVAMFLANHSRSPGRAVRIAAADLARRQDVYAHDTYAWALFAAGRHRDADAQMALALQVGTQDALLDYHAGMISAALGRRAEAIDHLRAALARNPGFDPLQAARATETLAALEVER